MNALTKFVVVALLLTSCGSVVTSERATSSGLANVKIAQTSVKDQGSVGFCWSYAMMGFIEAETLRTTGRTLDLSEEYLALIRMSAEIKSDLATMTVSEIKAKVTGGEYEGWFLRLPDKWDSEGTDAFEMVDQFGVLEESEWSVKFQSPKSVFPFEPTTLMANGGYKPALAKLIDTLDKDSSDASIMAAVAQSFGKDSPPAGHKIAIKSKDYVAYWAESASDVPNIVTKMKQTLSKGITVPLGYGVTFAKLNKANNYTWQGGKDNKLATYTSMTPAEARRQYAYDGGHEILVTDFVNKGGREGEISASALKTAVAADWSTLDHVVVKNSWSTDGGSMPAGYYRIDLSYMLGTAQGQILDVMVPR